MTHKSRAWLLIFAVAGLCSAVIGGVAWYRARSFSTPAQMLKRLRTRDAVVAYVDFAALRNAGILQMFAASKVAVEPEYQAFVQKTGFDYQQDLDSALVSFSPKGRYFLLRGRFDWNALRGYVESQAGSCYNTLCRMEGSARSRQISFFPLRTNTMAMAVSPDETAAMSMQADSPDQRPITIPDAPLWVSLPPSILRSGEDLPEGTRMFARALENAESAMLSIGPEGARFQAGLVVECRSSQDAAALAGQLTKVTTMLREMIVREHQAPNPRDLSGVLTAGTFRPEGTRVLGRWPIERAFFEQIVGSS